MPGNPVAEAAREVILEIPDRYDDYRADLLKALRRIATLDDPNVRSRRTATAGVVAGLAAKVIDKGGLD